MPDDGDPDENFVENYQGLLNEFSRQWYLTQLSHKVSATAAEEFWRIAKTSWPIIIQAKEEEAIEKKTPLFQNQRKKLQRQLCPDIHMEFGFLNLNTGAIVKVASESTPFNQYERSPNYVKLYEEAHIKVNQCFPTGRLNIFLVQKFYFFLSYTLYIRNKCVGDLNARIYIYLSVGSKSSLEQNEHVYNHK